MKPKTTSILFVCMGNICRSPAAEIIFRQMVEDNELEDFYHIDSAGTIGYHTGNAPDPRMSATLASRGYEPQGSARQITAQDLDDFDLILAMDHDNFDGIQALAEDEHEHKIKMFTDYCTKFPNNFVPDPYYGGEEGFEFVADLIEDGCRNLLAQTSKQA